MRILIPTAVFLVGLSLALSAFEEGPYPNVTGGFGEESCHTCHLDNPVNAPGGTLNISGVPPAYAPGQTYDITVGVARGGLRRGGFELSARYASGKQRGRQAGSWRLPDARMQIVPSQVDPALQFVQHTLTGTRAAMRGQLSWTVRWIAPTTGGPVQFNAAGNASNDDDSPLGDYIYLKTSRTVPQNP